MVFIPQCGIGLKSGPFHTMADGLGSLMGSQEVSSPCKPKRISTALGFAPLDNSLSLRTPNRGSFWLKVRLRERTRQRALVVKRLAGSSVPSGQKAPESLPPDAPGAMIRRSQGFTPYSYPHTPTCCHREEGMRVRIFGLSEVLLLPSSLLSSWYVFMGFYLPQVLLDFSVTLLGVSLSQIFFSFHFGFGSLMWKE